MTREVALSYANPVNSSSFHLAQSLARAPGTITNSELSFNMLRRFRALSRNAIHLGRSLGDVYLGAGKDGRCPDCTRVLCTDARNQHGADFSMHSEAQSRNLARGFSSWAMNERDCLESASQRNVATHAGASEGETVPSAETFVEERVTCGVDGDSSNTEVLEAGREEGNAGAVGGESNVATDGSESSGCGELDSPHIAMAAGVNPADASGEMRSLLGGEGDPGVSSSGESRCSDTAEASEINNGRAGFGSPSEITGPELKRKPSPTSRRAKVTKSSVLSPKMSSETTASSRGKGAKSAIENKKEAATDAPKSKVFKEMGRRPMAAAVRVASEERRRKEEMKELPATDLLTVKGIGPKYVGRFMEQGIKSVKDLEDVYMKKYYKKSEGMIAFLQSDIGVKQAVWAKSIVDHIEKSIPENEESAADDAPGAENTRKKPLTFCVEGNISVGKSTFLRNIVRETIFLKEYVDISPEPVEKWQSVGEDRHNILQSFYQDPQRYAYTFQNYVFFTRMLQAQEKPNEHRRIRLMERSVFSDRMVFVRAVHEAKYMSDMEISIYDSWFDPILSAIPTLVPDGFIYLRANPDTCFNRLKKRARAEETAVNLDYLQNLHEKHEQWLIPDQAKSGTAHSLRRGYNLGGFPDDIQDDVFSLRNSDVHPRIKGIPALVLDCDPEMDIERDVEKKEYYAKKVRSFYEHIEKLDPASDRHVIQPPQDIVQPTAEWYEKMKARERYEEAAMRSGGRVYGM